MFLWATSLFELLHSSLAMPLSLLTCSIVWNFPFHWLCCLFKRKNNPFYLTVNASPLCYYFWKEHGSPWFCNQEEKDSIYNVLLLVSSFSFKSPILLTCFTHVSSCMPSNIFTVLLQTLPGFPITNLRWERPEIQLFPVRAYYYLHILTSFLSFSSWSVGHHYDIFTQSFPEYLIFFMLFGQL